MRGKLILKESISEGISGLICSDLQTLRVINLPVKNVFIPLYINLFLSSKNILIL